MNRKYRFASWLGVGILFVWAVVGFIIGPPLIRSAFEGKSIGMLNALLAGQAEHDVEHYLTAWRALTWAMLGVPVMVFLAMSLITRYRHAIRRILFEPSDPQRPGDLFVIAIVFGVITGSLELIALAAKKYIAHQLIWVSPQVVWMSPLANILLFGVTALLLILFGFLFRGVRSRRFILGVFIFQGAVSVLLAPGWLGLPALLILAAGVSVAASRFMTEHAPRLRRPLRLVVAGAVLFVAAASAVVNARLLLRERRALLALPPARAESPNIVLIIWDTVRAKSVGLYEAARPTTPNLDRLARRGIVFERAYSTAPYTLHSHGSMFTGRLPFELTTLWKKGLGEDVPTLAEVVGQDGYATAGFVANWYYLGHQHGLNRGFAHYEDYANTASQLLLSAALGQRILEGPQRMAIRPAVQVMTGARHPFGYRDATQVTDGFVAWSERQRERPFFAVLNYLDAHAPYLPPPAFAREAGTALPIVSFRERLVRWASGKPVLTHGHENALDLYEAAIAYVDAELGRVLESLEQRGILDNTVLIVTSDHGEEFGEHGRFGHSTALNNEQLGVPLLIVDPRRSGPARVASVVSLRDIAATVLDLAHASDPNALPGQSLLKRADGTAPVDAASDFAYAEMMLSADSTGMMRAVIADAYKYVVRSEGRTELYDVIRDRGERNNLAADWNTPMVTVMESYLRNVLGCHRLKCGG